MRKWIEKIMPVDRFVIAVFAFVFNCLVYSGARAIASGWKHHVLTSSIDKRIPFLPASLLIYFGCYIFWIVNYVMIAKLDEERAYRFYFADFFIPHYLFCMFFSCIRRTNIRPEIIGDGLWEQGCRFLYGVDAADNLFPSIHCLVSWFCYLGIRSVPDIPKWYKNTSCILAVWYLCPRLQRSSMSFGMWRQVWRWQKFHFSLQIIHRHTYIIRSFGRKRHGDFSERRR